MKLDGWHVVGRSDEAYLLVPRDLDEEDPRLPARILERGRLSPEMLAQQILKFGGWQPCSMSGEELTERLRDAVEAPAPQPSASDEPLLIRPHGPMAGAPRRKHPVTG